MPEYMVYWNFFIDVKKGDDSSAQHYRASGRPDMSEFFRTRARREAGLTAREDEVLKSVAADCLEHTEAIALSWRITHPALRRPEDQDPIRAAFKKTVFDHVEELQTEFGPKRYAKLERYIRYRTRNIMWDGVE